MTLEYTDPLKAIALKRQNCRRPAKEELKFHEAYGLQRGDDKKLVADYEKFCKYLEVTEDPTKHEQILKEIEDYDAGRLPSNRQSRASRRGKNEAITDRDDLKFRSIAAYKAISKGDVQFFKEIKKKQIDLAQCKGYGLSDSSIEESDRQYTSIRREENDLDDDGRRSDNSEAVDSVRSSEDYWEELGKQKHKRLLT